MGRKAIFAGNGGSAASAQHFAGELVSRFYIERPPLPAIALTTDSSIITAVGNDYGYEQLFARQIRANGCPGDIFFALSTSGTSPNILAALKSAREMGIIGVGFIGENTGPMDDICDYVIHAPSSQTPRIQEIHDLLGHIVCARIEAALFGQKDS